MDSNVKWKSNIVYFLAGQAISLFGSMLVQYAIMWHIVMKTQSGYMMTISILCGMLPSFFISPFAGVWADRYYRKYLINLADGGIALTTLILALVFMAGRDSLWLMFLCLVIRSFGSGIQMPAVNAFIPQLVPEKNLTRVNAINSSIQSVTMLFSPMASAALMNFAKIEYIFFIDVVTAAISVILVFFFVKASPHAKAAEKESAVRYRMDLKEGFMYILKSPALKRFFLFCSIFYFFAAPPSFLTPLQTSRSFGPEVWRLGALEIAFFIGMTAGGILVGIWGGFKNRISTMGLAYFLAGAGTLFLGIMGNFWLYLTAMGIIGLVLPFFNTPGTVFLQVNVDEEFHGRVFGVLTMISSIMMPLGMIIFGPLADRIPINVLMVISGIIILAVSIFFASNKILRNAGIHGLESKKG